MIRKPCVNNTFYEGSREALSNTLNRLIKDETKEKACAILVPHAGYIYSGKVAGEVFSKVEIPNNVILIGPNHTGLGKKVSLMNEGTWQTPLGDTDINIDLADMILKNCPLIEKDVEAHLREHSLEVELPFIQKLNPNAKIVPITIMHLNLEESLIFAKALAKTIKEYKEEVLIVVSTDMNHFENEEVTRKKDNLAIDKIKNMDAKGLFTVVKENDISMCGVLPSVVAIEAANILNYKNSKLISHTTSGEVSRDFDSVVGYAGFIIN